MIRVLFVCHGNICRSPLAEFLFRDFVEKKGVGDQFEIASAATSSEEIGNPVHRGTRRILDGLGISCEGKRARRMTRKDYEDYDYLIGMDQWNINNMMRMIHRDPKKKVYKFLELRIPGIRETFRQRTKISARDVRLFGIICRDKNKHGQPCLFLCI